MCSLTTVQCGATDCPNNLILSLPSPKKVPTRMTYEGIARVWTILAHCAERRQQGNLIHRNAWKGNSPKFATVSNTETMKRICYLREEPVRVSCHDWW